MASTWPQWFQRLWITIPAKLIVKLSLAVCVTPGYNTTIVFILKVAIFDQTVVRKEYNGKQPNAET